MFNLSRRLVHLAILAALAVAMINTGAAGSVLTFGIDPTFANAGPMPQAYGDRIVNNTTDAELSTNHTYDTSNGNTPNVLLSYASSANLNYYKVDAEWPGVAYLLGPPAATPTFDFHFTPDIGFGVRINSFVLDDYAGFAAGNGATWTIYAGTNTSGPVLASSGGTVSTTNGQNLLQTTGLIAYNFGPVLLRVTHTAGTSDDFALDNLNFQQVELPEPATIGLLACCFGMLGLRRR